MAEASRASSSGVHGRFEPGTRLGTRYRIVGLLGRGGMGEVYRADDLELGQSVALKFLPERVAADPLALARFRNEVRTARQIAHPNVCRIYDIAEQDGHVFLSMEYIDGEDLAGVLRRLGRPSREKSIEIARQICLGLAAAHENKVLHRDLKPANIMIDGRGRVRITDFGLAGLADELDAQRERAGTPAYMAPEQLTEGKVSLRSDIYSLGLILHELFTGKRVFDTNDLEQLKRKHTSGTVSTPSSISDEIDPAVQRVILHCLEPQPEQRPQSVYQILAALPGGDPLAAALAAGETPSPELVANARDAGGLRPAAAFSLLAAMAVCVAVTYVAHLGRTVMPQRSPDELSVVATQIMAELGYDNLPRDSVSGYEVNRQLAESLRSSPLTYDELAESGRPPRFVYWRRWSDGNFIPSSFHFPEAFNLNGPTENSSFAATIALDSFGRLLAVRIDAGTWSGLTTSSEGDVNWSPLFRRAGVDESRAAAIPPIQMPPVHCDQRVAWQIEQAADATEPLTIHAGEVGGRVNYFWILETGRSSPSPIREIIETINEVVGILLEGLIVVLAWRNLRAGRGDRRNAFLYALITGLLYAGQEILAIRLDASHTWDQINGLFSQRAAGHIILHAFEAWLVYLAIEPYVRRVLPRMLVALVRLLSARLRDPAVGREVLVGVVAGSALMAMVALVMTFEWRVAVGDFGRLPSPWSVVPLLSPGQFVVTGLHTAAWSVLYAIWNAGAVIVLRSFIRNAPTANILAVALIGLNEYWWIGGFVADSPRLGVMIAAVLGAVMVGLYLRFGVLAAILAGFVMRSSGTMVISFDAWFAPYVIASLVILGAIALYGCMISLAGQPIFKDMLADPKTAR